MIRRLILISVLLLCIVLSGCNTINTMNLSPEEQKFIGTWENTTSNPLQQTTITSYRFYAEFGGAKKVELKIITTSPSFTSEPNAYSYDWRLEEGKLSINYGLTTWMKSTYSFVSSTELIIDGVVFEKVQ